MSNSNVKLVSLFTQTVIYRPWMKSKSKQIARLSLFYLGARLVNVLMFGHLTFKNFTLMSSSQVKTVIAWDIAWDIPRNYIKHKMQ